MNGNKFYLLRISKLKSQFEPGKSRIEDGSCAITRFLNSHNFRNWLPSGTKQIRVELWKM